MNSTMHRILLSVLLACGIAGARAEDFTSSITATHSGDTFPFTLASDSVVSLVSTLSGQLTCGNSGFGITASDQADVVRSSWCHLGQTEGPWPLKAGSYNLTLWNNNWSTGNYTASISITPQGSGDSEPNDTTATAASLALNTTATGHLGFYDALDDTRHDYGDYYRVTLPASGILSITTSNATTLNGAFGYTLYESDGSTIVRSTGSALSAGTYYILAWANSASAYGSYTLSANFTSSSSTSSLTTSATSLTFGNQEVGTSTTQEITLTNNGSGTATLSAITASGDFNLPWNACGSSLAAGTSCTLMVGFTPTATGTRTGTMTIQSNEAVISIALSGTGMVTTTPSAGSVIIQTPVTSAQAVNPTLIFAPAPSERNGTHNLYVAGLFGGQFYFLTIANWQLTVVPYAGGDLPVYMTANGAELYADGASGGYSAQTWQIPLGDLSSLHGLQLYAGFGRSAEDMLAKNQVQLIYTVP